MRGELHNLCPGIDWRLRIEKRIAIFFKIFVEEGQDVRLYDVEVVSLFIRARVEQRLICKVSMDESGQTEKHDSIAAPWNAGKLIDLRYRDSIGGLTTKDFDVEGCGISSGAVQRARLEGLKRELNVPFSTASMLQLTFIGRSSFDAVKSRSRAAEK
jgi:hypothetical protein